MPPASLSEAAAIEARPEDGEEDQQASCGRCGPGAAAYVRPATAPSRPPQWKILGKRFFQASGQHQVDGVVDGDDAVQLALVVDDGQGQQVVLGDHVWVTSSSPAAVRTAIGFAVMKSRTRRAPGHVSRSRSEKTPSRRSRGR